MNVAEPKFYKASIALLAAAPLRPQDLSALAAAHDAAPYLSSPSRDERFAFFDHTLRGVPLQKPRWKHCGGAGRRPAGRGSGPGFVDRALRPH